jgi:hypothetical protein
MSIIAAICLIAGLALLTYHAFQVMSGLSVVFPFASKSRWWWTKRMPLLGLGLLFMGVADGYAISIVGVLIIIGCTAWLSYCQKHQISG